MADLRVDYHLLEAMQRSLNHVAGQFEDLGRPDPTDARIWGGNNVRSAVEQFAGNWKTHRRKLTEDARKLAEQCGGTVEVFRAVDGGLSRPGQDSPPR